MLTNRTEEPTRSLHRIVSQQKPSAKPAVQAGLITWYYRSAIRAFGHVRREWPHSPGDEWVAVPVKRAPLVGWYRTAQATAQAMARASGR